MSNELRELSNRLHAHVAFLASAPRVPGSPEHARAREYVVRHLHQAGFNPRVEGARAEGYPCSNVLTDPVPAEAELPLVIVGAHYDSIPESPGADDNASAVAALLELARWIRPRLDAGPCQARLQLAAYDLEEYGLLGSGRHSWLLHQAKASVRGMIALEMLGFTDHRPGSQLLPVALRGLYPDVGNFIGVVGNEASAGLLHAVTASMKSVPDLLVEFIAVPGDGRLLAETRLSDHSSFWDRGYQALMITDTSFFRNRHYHKTSDTPQTLDYEFLAKVTLGACQAALQLVQHS